MTEFIKLEDDPTDVTLETEYTFAEGYCPTVTELYATRGRSSQFIVTRVVIRESGDWHGVAIIGKRVQKNGTVEYNSRPVYVAAEIEDDLWTQHQARKAAREALS